ncbi:GIY-YIG nuclease family protein [Vibrio fluminensis]|uniref:GIY-YIG nuclease family protein n=1 Tax=Vibrio fluminensis TaxID=2783614 RepID=UPI0032AEED2D
MTTLKCERIPRASYYFNATVLAYRGRLSLKFYAIKISMKQPAVYILSNHTKRAIYVGVTTNLKARVWQHKSGVCEGFTKRYRINRLVYFELFSDIRDAIAREKQIKNWKRAWKNNLIEQVNPSWKDMYSDI